MGRNSSGVERGRWWWFWRINLHLWSFTVAAGSCRSHRRGRSVSNVSCHKFFVLKNILLWYAQEKQWDTKMSADYTKNIICGILEERREKSLRSICNNRISLSINVNRRCLVRELRLSLSRAQNVPQNILHVIQNAPPSSAEVNSYLPLCLVGHYFENVLWNKPFEKWRRAHSVTLCWNSLLTFQFFAQLQVVCCPFL